MPPPKFIEPKDLLSCGICRRKFYKDRIAKHETICKKVSKRKRRVFDSAKQRVQGTDMEPYYRKPKMVKVRKNNWRHKHEEFIKTIRNARKVQQHLAKGGNIRDLPQPTPSTDDPDFIRCPSCNRTFNDAAAARHIPRCGSYQFNKFDKPFKPTTYASTSRGRSFRDNTSPNRRRSFHNKTSPNRDQSFRANENTNEGVFRNRKSPSRGQSFRGNESVNRGRLFRNKTDPNRDPSFKDPNRNQSLKRYNTLR